MCNFDLGIRVLYQIDWNAGTAWKCYIYIYKCGATVRTDWSRSRITRLEYVKICSRCKMRLSTDGVGSWTPVKSFHRLASSTEGLIAMV